VFENLRKTIAKAMAPGRQRLSPFDKLVAKALREPKAKRGGRAAAFATRMYQAARPSRLTAGFGTSTGSADSELVSSLVNLRNRSRALVRDAAYAKRAKVIVQNNVVGAGVGMQAQVMSSRDTLREDVNDAIEEAWEDWSCAEYCHTGGTLHFADFERACVGQVFEVGEVFIRKHYRSFGGSDIPFALELIEAERIVDEFHNPVPPWPAAPGAMVKMGIEVDEFGRPLAYWIRKRHPGDLRWIQGQTNNIERVPADQIWHLRLIDRQPQTRGEPWLHAVARKLNDMDGYSEAEIVAARAAANAVFTIETPDENSPLAGQNQSGADAGVDISKEFAVEPGMGMRLAPGEEFKSFVPNRPNTALDPFMRYMLREIAAGVGVSYESLSRDYSQSNFSASRLALLDDRDLWRMLQQWWIRNFRYPLHKEWLGFAVLAESIAGISLIEYGVNPEKFEAVLFKPRGWGWIDPYKEVLAYKEAIKAGLTTNTHVIAQTGDGRDIEDVLRERRRELTMMDPALESDPQFRLEFDTSPSVYVAAETGSQKGTGIPPAPDDESTPAPADSAQPSGAAPPGQGGNKSTKSGPPLRAVSFQER
jgi:lambda family phage portal protein